MSYSHAASVKDRECFDEAIDIGGRAARGPLFISTYVPTRCGLATFTSDLADAVDEAAGEPVSSVAAITQNSQTSAYPDRVVCRADGTSSEACRETAEFANESDCTVVSLQHDYGIYPGKWGETVLDFVESCDKPVVTTLHNLRLRPEPAQRFIVRELVMHSDAIVVPSECGVEILDRVYGMRGSRIHHIPHGVHPVGPATSALKHKLDLDGRTVVMTHGLLGRDKGIEYMIDGMRRIKEVLPGSLYVVAGRTHPKLPAADIYRESLDEWARTQGVAENVLFIDRFLPLQELLGYLACADVYVSPYPGREHIVSGALACALGAGKAVVSTPYTYAREMWNKGVLMLGNFRDGPSLAERVLRLVHTPRLKAALERRARSLSRTMSWAKVGHAYADLFASLSGVRSGQSGHSNPRSSVSA